ncbi:MAG: winged helix-turn-helix domain-containing protein [Candidatus Bathyarchaeota archaeon]|nr:winged helix-turn-helix domain-containing protein [Candidatus Bathyarchaeota archaeon]MDH5732216.1 winged helix-turn-helix domain-containing protein [Candidatus Bathyarchaeota archaeon]
MSDGHKRRNRTYIMAEILEMTKNGCLKTHIMYGANLSFDQLKGYMAFLLDVGLLQETMKGEKTVYTTTQKGVKFLEHLHTISDLML